MEDKGIPGKEPMINGVGKLSLAQAKEITDSWSVCSDMRPLVAQRLWEEIRMLKRVADAAKVTAKNLGVHPAAWHDPHDPEASYEVRTPEMETHNAQVKELYEAIVEYYSPREGTGKEAL